MKKYLKLTREGFTLVELMIVVAIIGVLASIAVPQYRKFQAKSRQTEVRIQLGATYNVEQSYAAENSSYTACLGQIGYNRDGTKFYYTVGFGKDVLAAKGCQPGSTTDGECNAYQWRYCDGVSEVGGCEKDTTGYVSAANCGTTNATGTDFFASNIAEPSSPAGSSSAVNVPATQEDLPATSVNSTGFTIGAVGKILSGATKVDQWTIDNSKQQINTQSGLN